MSFHYQLTACCDPYFDLFHLTFKSPYPILCPSQPFIVDETLVNRLLDCFLVRLFFPFASGAIYGRRVFLNLAAVQSLSVSFLLLTSCLRHTACRAGFFGKGFKHRRFFVFSVEPRLEDQR